MQPSVYRFVVTTDNIKMVYRCHFPPLCTSEPSTAAFSLDQGSGHSVFLHGLACVTWTICLLIYKQSFHLLVWLFWSKNSVVTQVQEVQQGNLVETDKRPTEVDHNHEPMNQNLFLTAWLMAAVRSICMCPWRFSALRSRVAKSPEAISGRVSIFTGPPWIGRERRGGERVFVCKLVC